MGGTTSPADGGTGMPVEIRAITGWTLGPLTHELRDPESPVRRFFDTRFAAAPPGYKTGSAPPCLPW